MTFIVVLVENAFHHFLRVHCFLLIRVLLRWHRWRCHYYRSQRRLRRNWSRPLNIVHHQVWQIKVWVKVMQLIWWGMKFLMSLKKFIGNIHGGDRCFFHWLIEGERLMLQMVHRLYFLACAQVYLL